MIATRRLDLLPATPATLDAALAGRAPLAAALGATVPETWPPEFLDDAALAWTRDRLTAPGAAPDWWMHFIVLREERTLIGSCGYKGPPSTEGVVEIGYGVVSDRRLRGYASEAAAALTARAFEDARVTRVIAETLPELVGSIGVLARCGFRRIEGASEPGVIRFAINRAD